MKAPFGVEVAALREQAERAACGIRKSGGGNTLGASLYAAAFDGGHEMPQCLRDLPSRTGGKAGAAMVPYPELRAAGWRLVPLPRYWSIVDGGPNALRWGAWEWVVIPPDDSPERARKFSGRGRAQTWASDRFREEHAASRPSG